MVTTALILLGIIAIFGFGQFMFGGSRPEDFPTHSEGDF